MFFDRTGGKSGTTRARVSKSRVFPAPFKGYIRSSVPGFPIKGGAALLNNWFPTTEGIRMRKGSLTYATLNNPVDHLVNYDGATPKFFAADSSRIYDITSPADPDTPPSAAVSSLTSGDWSSIQFQTSGGLFLVMVNGADSMRQYDGSSWATITGVSSPISITNVTTSDLSHVWSHKNRLFFIEEGTMSAWYLPSLAVGGAASELSLGGVFTLGGSLLFGATWSLDAGDGLDDMCLFVTTKGEVAVYQGTDPSSASTWALTGVYRIGEPLHKNAHFRAGGDRAILTREGIVPISGAVSTDRTGLQMKAITAPIEEDWRLYIRNRTGLEPNFCCVLWHTESMLLVGIPSTGSQSKLVLPANARTGAWSSGFTSWNARCFGIFDNDLYFGTEDNKVKQGDVTGSDDGATYQCVALPQFDMMGGPNEKSAVHARATIKTNFAYPFELYCNSNYDITSPTALPAPSQAGANTWGTAIWGAGASVWGVTDGLKEVTTGWQNVNAVGHALAPGISISSGDSQPPDVELISLELQYEDGEVMG